MRKALTAMAAAALVALGAGCELYSDDDTETTEQYIMEDDGSITIITIDGDGNTTDVTRTGNEVAE